MADYSCAASAATASPPAIFGSHSPCCASVPPSLIALAAPVYGFDGAVVAALSVSAPAARMTRDRLTVAAGHCVAEAAGLSAVLGYRQRASRQTRKQGAA